MIPFRHIAVGALIAAACCTSPQSGCAATGSAAGNLPPSSEAARASISAVVQAQADAIQAEDWPRAYEHAGAGIREKFSLRDFETMVRSTYPALLRRRAVTTLRVHDDGTQAVLELRVLADTGILVHFRYFLQLEDGRWRIIGVVPFEPPAVRA